MSLPPADQPFADEEEDRKRKAEIEDMMRWQRDSYFRNEPVQQEYRDVVTRLASNEEARREVMETQRDNAPKPETDSVSAAVDHSKELPAWFKPYVNPTTDLGRGETPQVPLDLLIGKSNIDPKSIARPVKFPVFDPKHIEYLERHPEAAPLFDKKYGVPGSAKRALDELDRWSKEAERRGDHIRNMGKDDPSLPIERPKSTPSNFSRLIQDSNRSLNLPPALLEDATDLFAGKPPEALPFEAAARANGRYFRDMSRSRQDIAAALDRTEGTFGAESKLYKQILKRREKAVREEIGKRFLDVAYKLTREEQEKVDPFGVYASNIGWAIANGMTHPLDALAGRAAGLPGWAGGLVTKYAPSAAKAAGSLWQGPAGEAAKKVGAYVAGAATGGAVGDAVEQGAKVITGEQEAYSAEDTLKAARDGVVEDAVTDATKASADAATEFWLRRHLPRLKKRR